MALAMEALREEPAILDPSRPLLSAEERAKALAKAASPPSLPSLNSLIYEVTRGPVWKTAQCVVAGVLGHTDKIKVIASRRQPVIVYESHASRVTSRLTADLKAFLVPHVPANVEIRFDPEEELTNVGTLFLFADIPLPCISFVPGATVIGEEDALREALRDHRFFPRACWRDIAAMEIAE